jgi:hypothetical protein
MYPIKLVPLNLVSFKHPLEICLCGVPHKYIKLQDIVDITVFIVPISYLFVYAVFTLLQHVQYFCLFIIENPVLHLPLFEILEVYKRSVKATWNEKPEVGKFSL